MLKTWIQKRFLLKLWEILSMVPAHNICRLFPWVIELLLPLSLVTCIYPKCKGGEVNTAIIYLHITEPQHKDHNV